LSAESNYVDVSGYICTNKLSQKFQHDRFFNRLLNSDFTWQLLLTMGLKQFHLIFCLLLFSVMANGKPL